MPDVPRYPPGGKSSESGGRPIRRRPMYGWWVVGVMPRGGVRRVASDRPCSAGSALMHR